jgi:allophanate hydrolase
MNLLDLASVAVPSAFTGKGLPFGVTLVGPAFSDHSLLSIASRIEQVCPLSPGLEERPMSLPPAKPVGDSQSIEVVVCGAHLEGLPLNWQLQERGGVLSETTTTAQAYRLYALAGGPPFRPALIRDTDQGSSIAVEVWTLPL